MKEFKVTQTIASRDSEALQIYFRDVNREEMITPEEEVELAYRIHQGDEAAKEKLVRANLRFVITVAKRYQQAGGLPLADLINEGNMGLIKAAEKFDETRGFKFISYAVAWIRQSIMQAIDNNGRTIRLPQNKSALISKIKEVSNTFEQENLRQPTPDELADIMEIPVGQIVDALSSAERCQSVDEPFSDGEGNLLDVLADKESEEADRDLMAESDNIFLQDLMSHLTEREKAVISKSFGMGCAEMSINDIALEMDLTRERVRQIRTNALRKMRHVAPFVPLIA